VRIPLQAAVFAGSGISLLNIGPPSPFRYSRLVLRKSKWRMDIMPRHGESRGDGSKRGLQSLLEQKHLGKMQADVQAEAESAQTNITREQVSPKAVCSWANVCA
jgi:hypothetical protein